MAALCVLIPLESSKAQSIELLDARSAGYINFDWAGMRDSTKMKLHITNRTEREWLVQIEVGTKLEPAGGNAQSMVVTKEVHVHMHPHDSQRIEVEAACLDISKPPPDTTDTNWTARSVGSLKEFIACVNGIIDTLVDSAPADERTTLRNLRSSILQSALWRARGASRTDWIKFFVDYQGMTQEEAEEATDFTDEASGPIVDQCPSI